MKSRCLFVDTKTRSACYRYVCSGSLYCSLHKAERVK